MNFYFGVLIFLWYGMLTYLQINEFLKFIGVVDPLNAAGNKIWEVFETLVANCR